ncbi:hypothetical protein P872_12565 [Rhodonellum psychrophilum GCM71 = DSM 17998]|uniref:Uncharacterized protein n=1 Tax=Rhodonellum psychrophilum GCM71 = DSM 17998 TaxID=1123057 RepID=U5BRW6_9BACT|nr:hypothetical protein P872_12565 [Rhodonellum psychrophilum GCM71 = DSM 17998]
MGGVTSFSGNGKMNLSSEEKEIYALEKALQESEIEK